MKTSVLKGKSKMKTLFNDNWFFTKSTLGNAAPKPVDLPHDWLIYNTCDLYETCVGIYTKSFSLNPVSGRRYSLLFDGVYMDSKVYVNGKPAGEWKYGYTSFIFDITALLKNGINEIRVEVNHRSPNTRWYSGAGIFRDVNLVETGSVHFLHNGIYITAKQKDKETRTVSVKAEIRNELSETLNCKLLHELFDEDGNIVWSGYVSGDEGINIIPSKPAQYAESGCAPEEYSSIFETEFDVTSLVLWDIENPYLYTVKSTLFVDGAVSESVENPLGFRTVEIDPQKGFFLNGRRLKLNGVCMHHDLGALGSAFNTHALLRQFESLRAMGVNAIRTSHNPAAEKYLELADRFGMLLISEYTDMWVQKKTEYDYSNYFKEWHERDVASWIRRDRNHPCVIMWSIGNEISDTNYEYSIDITRKLHSLVRRHDPEKHAFTTIGSNHMGNAWANKGADLLDAAGYNYFERLYNEHHEKYPERVIYGSETSSTVQSRGVYHFPYSNRLLTYIDEQCSCLGNCSSSWGARDTAAVIYKDRDAEFSLGQFIWSGWDYIGEPTPYFTKNSYFGQVDTAGFEKDTYFQYKAEWTDVKKAPFVHLLPYWDFNRGQKIDVRIYSNADTVELFLNDSSLGVFRIDHKNGTTLAAGLTVPYEPGVLSAVAFDDAGREIASDTCSSFNDTAKILMLPNKRTLYADGEDLIFVELRAVDKNGIFVANARDRINVSVRGAGRLIGLDNGDATDYDQYKGTSRKLFNGRLLGIIAAKKEAGEIIMTIDGLGFGSEELRLDAIAPQTQSIVSGNSNNRIERYFARKRADLTGISCNTENEKSPENKNICIRKIELTNNGPKKLTADCPETTVTAVVYPASATFDGLGFRVLNPSGVDANFVKTEVSGNTVKIKAFGDGEFRLCCYSQNDKSHPDVISELEFTAAGFGKIGLNPYELVFACMAAQNGSALQSLSFGGGILTPGGRGVTTFENVEFGDFGSDEITIPIFHWFNKLPLEIWDGRPDDGGELLLACTYEHESTFNVYAPNTFKLPKRLKGTRTISIVTFDNLSLQGFVFTKPDKAFSLLHASDRTRIVGDSFLEDGDCIRNIGNNVSIEFDNMDFGTGGTDGVIITGRTTNEVNPISIFFENETGSERISVDFTCSESYTDRTFGFNPVTGLHKVILVFLPGSAFDLKSLQFLKCR